MRYTLSIALGLAVLALTALVITLAVNHQHLREVRTELAKANEQLVQNRDAADQLEQTISNLKAELDAGNKARIELKENLDKSTSDAEKLRKDVEAAQLQVKDEEGRVQQLTAELSDANGERDKTKNKISELTQTADEAKTKLFEAEEQSGDLKEQLATASDQLRQSNSDKDSAQSKLNEAQSQLETLKAELAKAQEAEEQAKAKAAVLENSANEVKSLRTELDEAHAEIERVKGELEQNDRSTCFSLTASRRCINGPISIFGKDQSYLTPYPPPRKARCSQNRQRVTHGYENGSITKAICQSEGGERGEQSDSYRGLPLQSASQIPKFLAAAFCCQEQNYETE